MAGKLRVASWVTLFLLIAFQVSTVGAQTKITVGVAAMSPRTDSAPHCPGAGTVCEARDRGAHRAH